MRRAAEARTEATDRGDEDRHEALTAIAKAGPLYGILNCIGPLARLWGLCAFCFGQAALRPVLPPLIGLVLATCVRVPLLRAIVPPTQPPADTSADALESSAEAQARTIKRQALTFVLLLAGASLGTLSSSFDPAACGLRRELVSAAAVGAGLATATAMGVAWSLVAAAIPPEPLVALQGSGTGDVSTATEDELLRQMRPARRAASLGCRCAAIAVECYVDTLLLFVFLPAAVDGAAPGVAPAPPPSLFASALVALAYGSQHLRFRGEWLLCAGFGAVLLRGSAVFGGSLVPCLTATLAFATYRHLRRTHDEVRRFHGQ